MPHSEGIDVVVVGISDVVVSVVVGTELVVAVGDVLDVVVLVP